MENKNIPIYQLIVKYLQETCTPEECSQLLEWINTNQENESMFFEMKELFDSRWRFDAWEISSNHKKHISQKKSISIWTKWVHYAAMITILFGGSLIFYLSGNRTQDKPVLPVREIVVHNTRGVYRLTLPDGSNVWLHGGTTFTYPERFQDSIRLVDLVGEAYFEVQADKDYPFIVNTHAAKIRATGTEFNVTAYPDNHIVTTTLVRGEVDIQPNNNRSTPIRLVPSQQAMVAENSTEVKNLSNTSVDINVNISQDKEEQPMVVQKIDPVLFTDWKDGVYRFKEEPFRNIALRLEKMHGVDIQIESNELQNALFSGMFSEDYSLKEIFGIINQSNPIAYRMENKTVYIKNK